MVDKQMKMLDELDKGEQELGKSLKKIQDVGLNQMGEVSDDDEKIDVFAGASTGGKKDMNIFNCLVISQDSTWKGAFDIVMLIVSCYNIFGNAFYSAFGKSESWHFMILDQCVETLFLLDLLFCFC